MTPSEIAEWLELEADTLAHVAVLAGDAPHLRQAAATIRELEGKRCAEIESHGDTFEKYRTTSEALKIATEALEEIKIKAEFNGRVNLCMTSEMITDDAAQALARIKEV